MAPILTLSLRLPRPLPDMLEEFVEHVREGAKDVQKAIMGGPKAMQEVCIIS